MDLFELPSTFFRLIPLGRIAIFWVGRSSRGRALEAGSAKDMAQRVIHADGPVRYRRAVPEIHNAPETLRHEMETFVQAGDAISPAVDIVVMSKVVVAAGGVILSKRGRLVAESLYNTHLWQSFFPFTRVGQDRVGIDVRLSIISRLRGRTPYILLKQTFDSNYGHWLVECLPKLEAVARSFPLEACRVLVSSHHGAMQEIYRDSLNLCGIRDDQIREVSSSPVRVETLIYPLPITEHPWRKSPAIVAFLERLGAKVPASPKARRRLYISRDRAHQRRLLNEAEVLDIVTQAGFEVVRPETLGFVEQIETFQAAEIVVGPYGAGLTNIVFAPRGVTVLALTTQWMQDDFFWDLANLKDGRYVSLHGKAVTCRQGDYDADFEIDIAAFQRLLTTCLEPARLP